jgi:hypothetical protein
MKRLTIRKKPCERPLCARNSRSMGASLIFTGRALFRSDRRLAVIRIGLKDEAIKASGGA